MNFTYDPTTDVGRMRRTIPDRDAATAIFSDDELASFLADETGWRRASALALETIAADTVMTLRVTDVLGLRVDGARASDAILKRATALREQADTADASEGVFDWAEMVYGAFGAQERIDAELLRGAF